MSEDLSRVSPEFNRNRTARQEPRCYAGLHGGCKDFIRVLGGQSRFFTEVEGLGKVLYKGLTVGGSRFQGEKA